MIDYCIENDFAEQLERAERERAREQAKNIELNDWLKSWKESFRIATDELAEARERIKELEGRIDKIADDFIPSDESQAMMALNEMREALRGVK